MSETKKMKRDTNADLMNGIVRLVKENGWYDRVGNILDYYLPETNTVREISNYEFTFCANLDFGGSEGIYIDCYIDGAVDENNTSTTQRIPCGVFKTLGDDLKHMRIMGEFVGILKYYAARYMGQNFARYCPVKN